MTAKKDPNEPELRTLFILGLSVLVPVFALLLHWMQWS